MKNNEDFLQFLAEEYECYFASDFSKFVNSAAAKYNVKVEDFFKFLNNKPDKTAQEKCILGTFYFDGIGCRKDFGEARRLFQESHESKYAPASCLLANFHTGGCLEQNYDIAFKYTEEAANSGLWIAVYNLHLYYKHGWGVKKDPKKADELLQRSKKLTFSQLLVHLESNYWDFASDYRISYESFYNGAFDNFRVTAKDFFEYLKNLEDLKGESLCILADLHKEGIGTKRDKDLAKQCYKSAVKRNYAPALYALACLSSGYKALPLIADAAKANFRPAIYKLAEHYKHGWLLKPNYTTSLELFLKARDMGCHKAVDAIYSLISYVLSEVRCTSFDCSEKLQFLLKAKAQGFNVADDLARLLEDIGEGHKPEFVYDCYTLISPLDIACPNEMMVKVNIVLEMQMDRLRIQAAKLLGNRKEAFQNQTEMIPIMS